MVIYQLLTLARYVERNAKQANLVKKAENWRWSSVWRREKGTKRHQKMLSPWSMDLPPQYLAWLNKPQPEEEEKAIELATDKGRPFGNNSWLNRIVKKFGLQSTLRDRGRPIKGG